MRPTIFAVLFTVLVALLLTVTGPAQAQGQSQGVVSAAALKGRAGPGTGYAVLGVVRRGDVTVAISTHGIAPALAGLLREALDAILPAELERWIEIAKHTRSEWKRTHVPMSARRPLLLRALQRLYSTEGSP